MISNENQDVPEIFTKFSNEKTKEWNDIGISFFIIEGIA